MLDADTCYRAAVARDPRFDGVFYVAVSTTGVYCRPVCPARTPGRDRCTFFRTAPEAERAGYRACFRCRPELAPGLTPLDSVPRLVATAVARIEAGFLNERSIEDLAAELGVTDRHLRRAMESEIGVSPVELAQSRRLALAKQLLQDTTLGLAEVAFASGFQSVRRFNALFHERFGRPPSEIRRRHGDGAGARALVLRLDYRPPLDWPAMLAFLRARAVPGVEDVDDVEYRRSVRIGDRTGFVAVRPDGSRSALAASVSTSLSGALMEVTARLRWLFDLDAEPTKIAEHLRRDARLRPLVERSPGLRVPGAFDAFETAVRAVLGQQVSVRGATTLAGRLARRFGTTVERHLFFPRAEAVARASEAQIAAIGIPGARARTLRALARAFADGTVRLERGTPVDEASRALQALPGIGPWTAEYVAMRALRSPDAFPASDLGVRKALGGVTAEAAERRAEAWRPWRAYATFHLWRSATVQSRRKT